VQVRGLFTSASSNTGGSDGVTFTLDQQLGDAASATVGPAEVTCSPATPPSRRGRVRRRAGCVPSFNTRKAGMADGTGMFGPGWTSGYGSMSAPYTDLTRTAT